MLKITFDEFCGVRIEQEERADNRVTILTAEEVRQIAEGYELFYAMEDMRSHLAERYEPGGVDENGDWLYDREKYTDPILRDLTKEVLNRKENSESISDTYWFIVDWVLDDYDEGKVTI